MRQRPGEPVAAFQDDNVAASRTLGRTHELKRHVADLDRAGFLEPERFVLRVLAIEQAARRVGGKSGRQIQDAVPSFVGTDPGEHVAQPFGPERLKAFRHQRPAGGAAAFDVVLADGEIAVGIAQQHLDVVLPLDDAVVVQVVLRLDAGADEVRFHQPVRIDDMDEQFARAVRAHPGEIGCEIAALLFEDVAARAIGQKQLVAVLNVARPLDFRPEPGDEQVFFLLFGTLQLVDHRVGAGGDRLVGVGAEAVQIRRAESYVVDLPVGERLHQRQGPVSAREQLAQYRLAQFTGNVHVSGDQIAAHRGVAG